MIAAIPLKWFAAYIADIATDSSISLNSRSKRCLEILMLGILSAPKHTRAIVATVSAGYCPAAVSAESITASVPSNTAFATSITSARVGIGLLIIDSII